MLKNRILRIGVLAALLALASLAVLQASASGQAIPTPCVQFTQNGRDIAGQEFCEPLARDIHIVFTGSARFVYSFNRQNVGEIQASPDNAVDVDCTWHVEGKKSDTIKNCHWTDASGASLGDIPIPKDAVANDFELVASMSKVEWTGLKKDGFPKGVPIPAAATDVRFFFK